MHNFRTFQLLLISTYNHITWSFNSFVTWQKDTLITTEEQNSLIQRLIFLMLTLPNAESLNSWMSSYLWLIQNSWYQLLLLRFPTTYMDNESICLILLLIHLLSAQISSILQSLNLSYDEYLQYHEKSNALEHSIFRFNYFILCAHFTGLEQLRRFKMKLKLII